MALVNVAHKPITARGRQFDGTLEAMTDIIGARPTTNVSVTLTFDEAGGFVGLDISGGKVGSVGLKVGDWIVFPDDTEQPAFAVKGQQAVAEWQIV